MFHKISRWFEQNLKLESQPDDAHTVELATAVLLHEIMRADDNMDDNEKKVFQTILGQKFHLNENEIRELTQLSSDKALQAADFRQFTRVLNEECGMQEKVALIEHMWEVAYADSNIDGIEEHLIRKISDLLHIPHSEFIQAKLRVTEQ